MGRYIKLVKKHGLEISQPGLEPNQGLTWQMTKRRGDSEVHKYFFLNFTYLTPVGQAFLGSAINVWTLIRPLVVHEATSTIYMPIK